MARFWDFQGPVSASVGVLVAQWRWLRVWTTFFIERP
jgi:hypothetical protein